MSNYQEFTAFYRDELAPVVRKVDAWRRSQLKKTLVACGLIALLFGLACAWRREAYLVFGIGALALGAAIASNYQRGYRAVFKRSLVEPLIRRFDPSLSYHPGAGIHVGDFNASGLFREHEVTEYKSEDFVGGVIADTRIRFSEVDAKCVTERGRGRREVKQIFKGLYVIADFNKYFSGATYVLPDYAERLLGRFGKSLQASQSRYGELVKLEDPEFERWFATYSSSQVEARYILSSALMARITRFRLRHKRHIRLGFVRNTLYVALDMGRDLFEPRFFRSIDDPALFEELRRDLAFITGIVQSLALDTRIWTRH